MVTGITKTITLKDFATAIGNFQELKTLLLKIPHTLVIDHGKVNLVSP